MPKQLERQLKHELEARSVITKALAQWYGTLTASQLNSPLAVSIGRKLSKSRSREINIQCELRSLIAKNRNKRRRPR